MIGIHAGAVMSRSTDPWGAPEELELLPTLASVERMLIRVRAACLACTRTESLSQVWTTTSPA